MTRRYDFALILATVALLLALGALCVYGTLYSFLASRADQEWTSSAAYELYLGRMNSLAYPLVAGLVLVMGMCVPKRLIPYRLLPAGAAVLALAALVAAAAGPRASLAAVMLVSLAVQAAVAVLAIARHARLFFEREGHLARLGSALLHLGFVLFALDLAALNESPLHITLFWAAALLMTAGTALAFYSEEISRAGTRLRRWRA